MEHAGDSGATEQVRLARLLFGELAQELDRALGDDHGVSGSVDRALDEAVNEIRKGEAGKAAFIGLHESEAARLADSFHAARSVASLAGLTVPEPEEFWLSGAQREKLARALISDHSLVAVPAPYGLGANRWIEVFRAVARQQGSTLSLTAPLTFAPEVLGAFASLDSAPARVPSVRGWTLRLVPGDDSPARMGVNYSVGPHATLPEMLMLQLMNLVRGADPVDRRSFTWLQGTFADGKFAARHFYDESGRGVGVNAREIGNQGPHLGVRTPVS
ncbi:hypothetical protein [Leucobacter denitrificans]|uniref:Uncharacterized protein n=1 Tax=Leucobacter denitrificans TaxID=683042 RepID=A0A7G9S5J1_9MICO|nr:hypothetical protein [Leucobacter denitrificans]QNN63116.1 hypothetical protein H9L06_01720 [Leucobacter denitrificans]